MRLTRDEIYVVVFLLTALVVGSVVQHCRHRASPLPPPPAAAE